MSEIIMLPGSGAAIYLVWQEPFAACGVITTDIELYAEQIDRPFLRNQCEEASG